MERAKLVNSAEDFTVSLKNQLVIQNEKPDIYITDAHYFDMFVDQGPFIGLDEHLDETTPEEALKFHQREQDPVEQLYGIDIAKSSLFDDIEITGSEMIASVHQKVPVP